MLPEGSPARVQNHVNRRPARSKPRLCHSRTSMERQLSHVARRLEADRPILFPVIRSSKLFGKPCKENYRMLGLIE
jgi:hypothetical protein